MNHYWGSRTKLILEEALVLLLNLWPYLVSGIIITTLIKTFLRKEQVARFFVSGKNLTIIVAALIGVVSPLGSYIVIPLSAALSVAGVPLPVLMALLVSSPLIDPTLFLLTSGAFGIELALARLVSAFILGVSAGYFTRWMITLKWIKPQAILRGDGGASPMKLDDSGVKPDLRSFLRELYRLTWFISKYFFLAIFLAAWIKILMPLQVMLRLFGENEFLTVLFTTGAGIPFYVCGGAAIPVVQQLAELGMSSGAALAFFISGPITKISNLVLMQALFRSRVFLIYLATGILGAAVSGIIMNMFF
ncbi:MAG: permease [Bacteroidales bacterium]|nr:permease [Bacteroidales bacterium]